MLRCDNCEATSCDWNPPLQEWHWVRISQMRHNRTFGFARDAVACSDTCLVALMKQEGKSAVTLRFK